MEARVAEKESRSFLRHGCLWIKPSVAQSHAFLFSSPQEGESTLSSILIIFVPRMITSSFIRDLYRLHFICTWFGRVIMVHGPFYSLAPPLFWGRSWCCWPLTCFFFYFIKNQIGANGITSEIFVSNDALAPRCMEHIFVIRLQLLLLWRCSTDYWSTSKILQHIAYMRTLGYFPHEISKENYNNQQ